MKYINLSYQLLIFILLISCVEQGENIKPSAGLDKPQIETVIEITTIAGKSPSEVATILGKPSSITDTKYGEKHIFSDSEIEIVFIDGLSDWITIEAMDNVPFSSDAIVSLGLPHKAPTISSNYVKRWEGIKGLLEVSIFPLQGHVDYVYVKTKTK